MQFPPTTAEIKDSKETDEVQLARMSSADIIRLKRAHKVEKVSVDENYFVFILFSLNFFSLDQRISFLKTKTFLHFMHNQLNK